MVKLTVFLHFRKDGLNHSGKQYIKEDSKSMCFWVLGEIKDEFIRAGWVLVEERVISIEWCSGGVK